MKRIIAAFLAAQFEEAEEITRRLGGRWPHPH